MAGLLILPGRLLGPDSSAQNVVALSTTAPRPVQAAPVTVQATEKAPAVETTAEQRTVTPVRVPVTTPRRAVSVKIAHYTLGAIYTKPRAKPKAKRVVVHVPAATTNAPLAGVVAAPVVVPVPNP